MDLKGKIVVFTGKISVTRDQAWALVEKAGGTAGSDISGNTNILVVGEKPGSKLTRAALLGIQIISEKEFFDSLKEDPQEDILVPLSKEELEDPILISKDKWHTIFQQKNTRIISSIIFEDILNNYPAPLCPNCSDEMVLIEDFGLYHCMFCGQWSQAHYSLYARSIKHHCLTHTISQNEKQIIKQCIGCSRTIILRPEDIIEQEKRFKDAPILFQKLKEENLRIKEKIEKDKKEQEVIDTYLKSLTPEQIEELRRQYNEV
jgi:hypothetical protein